MHGYAHLRQLGGDAVHVLGDHVADQQPSACGGHGGHIGTGLDLVGNNAVSAAAEALHAPDADGVRAGALDVGPHGVEEVGQVHNVRLLGGVFDDSATLGQHSGHHNIHGGTYGHYVQIYRRTHQTAVSGGVWMKPPSTDTSAPIVVKPLMCWSMGRTPKSHPPGMATVASPKRPSSAPKTTLSLNKL